MNEHRSFLLITKAILSVLWLIFSASGSRAGTDCDRLLSVPDYKPEDLASPMRFFSPEKYACLGNAVNNPYLAIGTITEATPSAFAEFAKKNPPYATIEFASPGGSLLYRFHS
jgi:hypothetical protein